MPGRCEPNRYCVYECQRGYVRSSAGYTDDECPPVAGQCSDVYHYKTSHHGLFCDSSGTIQIPQDTPLCVPVPSYIKIHSQLTLPVTGCATVYPGTEDILSTPYTALPNGDLELTLFPPDYWKGVGRHFYVGVAGLSPLETCQWNSLPKTAYIWGGHLEFKDGEYWNAANFDFSENFVASSGDPGYSMVVNKCSASTCTKYCLVQRKVINGVTVNYSAKYNAAGTVVSESTNAASECFVYGPVSSWRMEVELIPN